jgi:methylmalonyl-CoA mutase
MVDALAGWTGEKATREAWLRLAERALKGADVEAPVPGCPVAPLRERVTGAVPIAARPAGRRWRIIQRVDHPDAAQANALALADLEGGADGLALVLAGSPSARGLGLAAPADMARALDGVVLDIMAIRLEAGSRGIEAATRLLAIAKARGHDPAALDISFGHDPIGAYAAGAPIGQGWSQAAGRLVATVIEAGHRGAVLAADGRPYHDAGATPAQELAAVSATFLAYLRAIEAAGLPLVEARARLDVSMVADQDIFASMAKLRAARLLIGRIEEACGLAPAPIRLHAETSWRMTTRLDPWSDMIRATLAGFAAGLGGADSLAVLPFSTALGLPDGFARRVARNAQHVLMAEANLHRVADPAAGSGTIEAMTDRLCLDAWALFQTIEGQGGIARALAEGVLQRDIAEAVRLAAVDSVIVGTTLYRPHEPVSVATLAHAGPVQPDSPPGERLAMPMHPVRLAEAAEAVSPGPSP